ncbi:MAG: hypothetical protein ACR2RE_25450 [Geminicoccaceae bacterium]
MTPGKTSFGAVLSVNGKLLAAFIAGGLAWLCWPDSSRWWQMGLFSVALWFGAAGKLIQAIRAMIKIHVRDKEIAAFMAQGRSASHSELATKDALHKAGMTDG